MKLEKLREDMIEMLNRMRACDCPVVSIHLSAPMFNFLIAKDLENIIVMDDGKRRYLCAGYQYDLFVEGKGVYAMNENYDGEFYVVPFTSAGMIGAISIMGTKELAQNAQRQLRAKYPSVRIMTREKFLEALEKESEERSVYR